VGFLLLAVFVLTPESGPRAFELFTISTDSLWATNQELTLEITRRHSRVN